MFYLYSFTEMSFDMESTGSFCFLFFNAVLQVAIFEANAKHLCHIQVKITVRFMPTCITSHVVAAEPDLGLDGYVWIYETQELLPLIQYFCSARAFFLTLCSYVCGFLFVCFFKESPDSNLSASHTVVFRFA